MIRKIGSLVLPVSIFVFVFCMATIAAAQSFNPVPQVDEAQKTKAAQAATTTLSNWYNGKFAPLSDDFTQQMKERVPPEAQKQVVTELKETLGDFQSMDFAQALVSPSMPGIVVYRFKGKFSKESAEIRVVLDQQGKVAGFWVKPWQQKMQ